jgi:hypothetical protein
MKSTNASTVFQELVLIHQTWRLLFFQWDPLGTVIIWVVADCLLNGHLNVYGILLINLFCYVAEPVIIEGCNTYYDLHLHLIHSSSFASPPVSFSIVDLQQSVWVQHSNLMINQVISPTFLIFLMSFNITNMFKNHLAGLFHTILRITYAWFVAYGFEKLKYLLQKQLLFTLGKLFAVLLRWISSLHPSMQFCQVVPDIVFLLVYVHYQFGLWRSFAGKCIGIPYNTNMPWNLLNL